MSNANDRCAARGCYKSRSEHPYMAGADDRWHYFVEPAPQPAPRPGVGEYLAAAKAAADRDATPPEPTCAKPGCGLPRGALDHADIAAVGGHSHVFVEPPQGAPTTLAHRLVTDEAGKVGFIAPKACLAHLPSDGGWNDATLNNYWRQFGHSPPCTCASNPPAPAPTVSGSVKSATTTKQHVYMPSNAVAGGARLCLDCGKSRGRGNHYARWYGADVVVTPEPERKGAPTVPASDEAKERATLVRERDELAAKCAALEAENLRLYQEPTRKRLERARELLEEAITVEPNDRLCDHHEPIRHDECPCCDGECSHLERKARAFLAEKP